MSGGELPSFGEFFEGVHGYAPFPWQARLAKSVLGRRSGEAQWPTLLDLPTGTGKTSAMDVALYALAAAPERMPRRIVMVVDRRIVVDQGAEQARKLLRAMMAGQSPAVREIARRLRAIWGGTEDEEPFSVAILRGGMPRDNDWSKRPDQPVVGVSTIDQVGSRLLFRGYGVSAKSASIHAGLLGNDTLFLLDEVHLATAFAETLRRIGEHYRKKETALLARRLTAVPMSATPGGEVSGEVFQLDGSDRKHPVLARRLGAHKPARLEEVEVRGDDEAAKREVLARRAVERALELQEGGARVVALVVNRVDTARLAWSLLSGHGAVTDRLLVTGRMRPIDRDRLVRSQLLPRAGTGADRVRSADTRIVVVATQCIEAGADLDFDGMVTECASLEALRQRFGRLDRRGDVSAERGEAPAVILCRSDLAAGRTADPIYGPALAATWSWLTNTAKKNVIGFGIDELGKLLPEAEVLSTLLSEVKHAPVLLPAHLDAWAHTSPVLRPSPEPDLSLWLHGPERTSSEVQVIWRADLELGEKGKEAPRDIDSVREVLAHVRPSALEAMSLPLHAVRNWLTSKPDESGIGDALAERPPDEEEEWKARRKRSDAGRWYVLARRDESPEWRRLGGHGKDADEGAELRPGDTVIVPVRYGGINSDGSFDPEATDSVVDLGDLAQLRGRARPTLRLTPDSLAVWGLPEATLAAMPAPLEDETAKDSKDRIAAWSESWPEAAPPSFAGTPAEWRAMRTSLRALRIRPQVANGALLVAEPRSPQLLRNDPLAEDIDDAVTEDDDSSFRAREVGLRQHCGHVQEWAERLARNIGFDAKLVSDLALAGWLHDVGKADPRFQRWLVGGDEIRAAMQEEPLAKSALPPGNKRARELALARSGYPKGYRHELLSLAMIQRNDAVLAGAHDRELVLHLVASHHGWCRPFAPPIDHPDETEVSLQHGSSLLTGSMRHRAGQLSSGVAQRFWSLMEKYGWWGLAWLEAVMRLADHRASEEEQKEAS